MNIQNLQSFTFPDIKFSRESVIANIEVKGILGTSNLIKRIDLEVIPKVKNKDCDNFLLLILFPCCPNEDPIRVKQLIEGYYVYEKILNNGHKKRKVLCQCFTSESQLHDDYFTVENLTERIVNGFFKLLDK